MDRSVPGACTLTVCQANTIGPGGHGYKDGAPCREPWLKGNGLIQRRRGTSKLRTWPEEIRHSWHIHESVPGPHRGDPAS